MGLYGKKSLINEVSKADTEDINDETSMKAKKYLNKTSLAEVRTESAAGATFYDWVSELKVTDKWI